MTSLLTSIVPDKNTRREIVEVKRLDGIQASHLKLLEHARVFLKMDTQGYDLEVFRGAGDFIDRVIGMQSELSIQPLYEGMPHYLKALQVYESRGFELFNLSVVNRIETGGLLEMNCFMRRTGAR